jgi:hypothetical protein
MPQTIVIDILAHSHAPVHQFIQTLPTFEISTVTGARAPAKPGKTSKYRGVSFNSQRRVWVASIKITGHRQYLGRFETEEAAARAYDRCVAAGQRHLCTGAEWPPHMCK